MKIGTLQRIKNRLTKDDVIKSPTKLKKCKDYLYSLPEPDDEIDRSYYQYLTQEYYQNNPIVRFLQRFYCKFKLKREAIKLCQNEVSDKEEADAVFFNPLGKEIIPNELKSKYAHIAMDNGNSGMFLLEKDLDFIYGIYKKHHDAYFVYKLMFRIAAYRNLIAKYNPKAIIATSEYSFCSSVLTKFCRNNDVAHINIMHGDKLFDMTSTFFEFDCCYVWDEHYIRLFRMQRAQFDQFIISTPNNLIFDCAGIIPVVDLKVFLSNESNAELRRLRNNLIALKTDRQIEKIVIRPHPIYSPTRYIKKLFGDDFDIEVPQSKNIDVSIMESRCVMARYSTVLLQAMYNHVNIILDDCTSPKLYKMLLHLNYNIISFDNTKTLSSLLIGK